MTRKSKDVSNVAKRIILKGTVWQKTFICIKRRKQMKT